MSHRTTMTIPADHPSLPGHFPGAPVVPGVVLLQAVTEAVRQWRGEVVLTGLPTAKFLHTVAPGTPIEVELDETAPGRIRFECRVGDTVAAQGQLHLDTGGEGT